MILVTGASGFVGRAAVQALRHHPSPVATLGRRPAAEGVHHIQADLQSSFTLPDASQVQEIIHLAGKAHSIPCSQAEAAEFHAVNTKGTRHLLQALEPATHLQRCVLLSTVAVYGLEKGTGIGEDHPCYPVTPYGKSKLEAERLIRSWCAARGVDLVVVRAPLIVGPQPPGNLGSMIRLMRRGLYISITDNPARRSMILLSDLARFLALPKRVPGTYHITDSVHPSIREFERELHFALLQKPPRSWPSRWIARIARVGDLLAAAGLRPPLSTPALQQLTTTLTFDDRRVHQAMQWEPQPVLSQLSKIFR